MASATAYLTVIAGIIAIVIGAIYLFGIPPELKRKMQEEALKQMGENKASYLVKDQISKMPASDQEDVKQVKEGLGNALGGGLKNPLGDKAGDLGDDLTSGLRGR